jgi:putative CocE/NonD family hydrolase
MRRWLRYLLGSTLLLGMATRYRAQLFARLLNIAPPSHSIHIQRNIMVASVDAVQLATDHYHPNTEQPAPAILIRSPYGRRTSHSTFGALIEFCARRFAERGYHVIVQDVRGRFDSTGEFDPFRNEQQDGIATLDWLRQQTWFNGEFGTWGASYLGMVQWAIANQAPELKAMMPIFTGTQLRNIILPEEALDMGLIMRWIAIFHTLDKYRHTIWRYSLNVATEVEQRAHITFDQHDIPHEDQQLVGHNVDFYQQWLAHSDPNDELWNEISDAVHVEDIRAKIYFIAGWHDFFLQATLQDYATQRIAGQVPHLMIGAWQHFNNANGLLTGVKAGLQWFDAHLKSSPNAINNDKPVKLYIMGAEHWQGFDHYPPNTQPQTLSLTSNNTSEKEACIVFDPQNPPPFIGGAQFTFDLQSFKDQHQLMQRPDTLVMRTAPFIQTTTIIGKPQVSLNISNQTSDSALMVRLCVVHADGRIINLCDGYQQLPNDTQQQTLAVTLWDTAYTFTAGQAVAIIITGGAYPHWIPRADWEDHDLCLRPFTVHLTGENTLQIPVHK